ncbi:hypothetical protein QEZ54_18490 [Catellatospora sp. KI3]|uniref:hypothetical protein n=1 Tax=Catellatospora sp. KI3 TaxID=3041620 RepID=UPI002482C702|nr:hypothetical protein [Catellatospora sp. KI3]MDI1462969.1 hypothetical protein [Catellatospora sp. KI3]
MRARQSLAAGAAILVAFAWAQAGAAPVGRAAALPGAATPPLVAYSGRAFGGDWQSYGTGVFDNARGELGTVGNDAISSLRVAPGYRAVGCVEGGGEGRVDEGDLGRCRIFGPGGHDSVGRDLDDKISLLAVYGGPARHAGATAYQGPGFTGADLPLGPGGFEAATGALDRLGAAISSLAVEDGYRVVACDRDSVSAGSDADLGLCRLFGPGRHSGVGDDLQRRISLVAVGGPALTATSDAGMAGLRQTFGPGIHQALAGELSQVGNDAVTALRVADGYRVIACADDRTDLIGQGDLGLCRLYGPGDRDLSDGRLNDAVSLLAVYPGGASGDSVLAYADRDLNGASAAFGPGWYPAADLGKVGNDTASSLKVRSGRAVACEHDRERLGTCRLYTVGDHPFVGTSLNDRISLLAVAP